MKTQYLVTSVVMLALLLAFSTPVMAQCLDDIKTRYSTVTSTGFTNGTITDGTVKVLVNNTPHCEQNWTITLPQGEVVVAYVHWHRWGECPNHNPTAEFWNADGYYQSISIPDTLCPSGNNETRGVWYSGFLPRNHHYYWRVNATPGVNIFRATGCYDTPGEFCARRWFVAVIKNSTEEEGNTTYWLNYGLSKIYLGHDLNSWFYGTVDDVENKTAMLWLTWINGGCSDRVYFNDELIAYGTRALTQGKVGLFGWEVSSLLNPSDNHLTWDTEDSSGLYVTSAILVCKDIHGGAGIPDLAVTGIEAPEMMKPGCTYQIKAIVRNTYWGGNWSGACAGPFNVSLYIDGEFYEKKRVESGLPPSAVGIPVNFTVNLPYGCHEFKAVADVDNEVNESREDNNVAVENFQCGYSIVVRSNSDLVENPYVIIRYGTYYLENLTIENCRGCGIIIENTTLPIVIQNCTIHNCGYAVPGLEPAGIYLHNVTNVTIRGNTIENNTDAGIRVKNSRHVDIMDNYIRNNSMYGIYVYPDQLVKPPYPEYVKFLNITNNTIMENVDGISLVQAFNCTVNCNVVRDNTKYGIYACGNYSCIYSNEIINNTVYGMKLFNASHNLIFWNDFIDNNRSNPEYPKHQAYDNGYNQW